MPDFNKLAAVSKAIRECTICPQVELCHVTGSLVNREGPENDHKASEVIFVGEAPGEVEAEQGIPFCGPSGVLLREALEISNITAYTLLNVLKCRPPNNRDPSFTEAKNCYPYLKAQIEGLQPKKVVALGKVADEALKALRIKHVSVNHPSWALRQEMKAEEYSVEITRVLFEEKVKEVITGLFPSMHTHSEFSVGDSIRSPEEIVAFCKAGGMSALALTDHGTLGGVYDFEDAALKAELPYIIGYEAYVTETPIEEQKKTLEYVTVFHDTWRYRIKGLNINSKGEKGGSVEIVADNSQGWTLEEAEKAAPAILESKYRENARLIAYMKAKGIDQIIFKPYGSQQTGHMNIWVTSSEGWKNLLFLHNEAARVSTDRKPHVFIDSIRKHDEKGKGRANGLIFGSACIGGFLAQKLLYLGEVAAYNWLEAFAKDLREQGSTFVLEVMPHPQVQIKPVLNEHEGLTQAYLNRFLIDAGEDLVLNVIVTTDSHYDRPEDKEPKMQAMAMAYHKKEIAAPPDPNKDTYFPGNSYYFMTEEEVTLALSVGEETLGVRPEEVDNLMHVTRLFAEQMAMLAKDFKLPREFKPLDLDPAIDFDAEVLIAWKHLRDTRFVDMAPETVEIYENRLRMEIDRIKRKGFGWYFKVEKRFADRLREEEIPVGPGRGSAGGSLMAYVLGITHVDPIEYGLLFERFMSEERNDPPDIDLDVATSRRGEAVGLLAGLLKVKDIANIMDYGRWKKDMAARDVCWLLEEDQYEFEHNGAGADIIQPLVNKITDHIRYRGTHASGFIGFDDLDTLFPLAKLSASREIPSIEFELNTLNRLGLAKFDILGLTELDNIYMLENPDTHKPILDASSYDGPKAICPIKDEMVKAGLWDNYEFKVNRLPPEEIKRLLVDVAYKYPIGLFQIKTSAGNMTMNELKPTTFEELIHVIAINRPGPRESGMVELYKKRKFDREPYIALPSTEETYGCPIFQEQILVILKDVFGMSLGEADEVRRHISKKKLDKLQKVEEGLTEALLNPDKRLIWDQVLNWAAYGFNRAHATAYAVLSLMTIWAKDKLPALFYAHFLNLEPDKVKRRAALREAISIGNVVVARPNANFNHGKDFLNYQASMVEDKEYADGKQRVILGFNTIKGLAEKTSAKLVKKLAIPEVERTKAQRPTVLQELLLKRAGFWGPKEEPFLYGPLPLDSIDIIPWHTYEFTQTSLSDVPPGTFGTMTLIIHEGVDHIMRVEDNGGAYRLYSQGVNITKEDLKKGLITGLFFKGENNKVYLIEKEGYFNPEKPIDASTGGFRVTYCTKPINSKAGNWYALALLKTPLKSETGSSFRMIEAIIMAPEPYLKKLHRSAILQGGYGNGFFRWDYEKQLGELKG
jgi:DNA polymerase III alpha subunit/uracil-DNA glycosylase